MDSHANSVQSKSFFLIMKECADSGLIWWEALSLGRVMGREQEQGTRCCRLRDSWQVEKKKNQGTLFLSGNSELRVMINLEQPTEVCLEHKTICES